MTCKDKTGKGLASWDMQGHEGHDMQEHASTWHVRTCKDMQVHDMQGHVRYNIQGHDIQGHDTYRHAMQEQARTSMQGHGGKDIKFMQRHVRTLHARTWHDMQEHGMTCKNMAWHART